MNRPAPEVVEPYPPALDPRFGVETEVRLAELRRLAMNARVEEEIRAGTWPVFRPLRTGALNAV